MYEYMVAVKHQGSKGENPHYHMVIRTDIEQQTFRKRMKKNFPDGKGNAHMSIKGWDGNDKALSYLFHEETTDKDAELIVIKGITSERLEFFRTMNLDVQEKIKEAKTKSAHLLWENAYNYFKSQKSEYVKQFSHDEIAKYMILDALRHDKYVPQAWLLKAMTFKVLFMLQEGHVRNEEATANEIMNHLWPPPWKPT